MRILLIFVSIFSFVGVSAQENKIKQIQFSKERQSPDSLLVYDINSTIELNDTSYIEYIETKIKGLKSDSLYSSKIFFIPKTEGIVSNGAMIDKQNLFLNIGLLILKEPVILEVSYMTRFNFRSSIYQVNE